MSRFEKIWDEEYFKILLEDKDGYAFIHCELKDDGFTALKSLKAFISNVLQYADEEGFDGVHGVTANNKLAEFIPGAVRIGTVWDNYGVYKWTQQQRSS